jgi:hypothetical protein
VELDNVGVVIATRDLDLADGRMVTVTIGRPEEFPDGGGFYCPYQITGIGREHVRYSGGIDAVQALQLALQLVGTELHVSKEGKARSLTWGAGQHGDLGFPLPQILRDPQPSPTPRKRSGFCIAIRVKHPTMSPDLISSRLSCEPHIKQMAGAPRMTLKGKSLPGNYKSSFWVLDGPSSDHLSELIFWANNIAGRDVEFLRELTQTGGRVDYFIGSFVDSVLGASIEPAMLAECARLGIALELNIYGPHCGVVDKSDDL